MHFARKISAKPFLGLRVKTFPVLLAILLFTFQQVSAQIFDDFSDGDFTANPSWHGSTAHFVVNASAQLQLSTDAAGTSWLSTAFNAAPDQNIAWEFYLKQSFDPSSANFSRFYLMSDQPDLSGPLNGYYLQFGEAGSNDAVELFRQTGEEVASVCRASSGAIASAFALRVRVTRNSFGDWQMLIGYNASATLVVEASGNDNIHRSSRYAGMLCTYTITNATRFFYDDVHFSSETPPDTNPPEALNAEAIAPDKIRVAFSEDLQPGSAASAINYFIPGLSKHPIMAELQADQRTVLLTFPEAIENGSEQVLHVENVSDLTGNPTLSQDLPFLFFLESPVAYRDVIISEFLADPLPEAGLPPAEFVELYNRSENPIQLAGWTLADATSRAVLPDFMLLPRNFVVVCAAADFQRYHSLGPAAGVVTLPTLNNSADHLSLADPADMVIDSLTYDVTWYNDEDKSSGGWTLERIDPEDICDVRSNWSASVDPSGGTPGRTNSVHESIPDLSGPVLTQIIQLSSTRLALVFDERLSEMEPDIADFVIDPAVPVINVSFADISLSKIMLDLGTALDSAVTYRIAVQNIYDCPGNLIQPADSEQYLNKDGIVPYVTGVQAISSREVSIRFSESVSSGSEQAVMHYDIAGKGNPATVELEGDARMVTLKYDADFDNGKLHTLAISGITDLAGNEMRDTVLTFLFYKASPVSFKDVIFTEVLADPSPPVGLPEAEYIELYNRSANPVDLAGWALSDEGTMAQFGHFILLPGAYAIATNAPEKFSPFGNVLPVRLPTLNNARDVIRLTDRDGNRVDSLEYLSAWHNNDTMDGGWSLELIDPENICAGASNWTVSESMTGGTPGKENSVRANLPDNTGPVLLSAVPTDSLTITLVFNESLENRLPPPADFMIKPQTGIADIRFNDALLTTMTIIFATPLDRGKPYSIAAQNIYDCSGNALQSDNSQVGFILPERATKGDVVINEILFNPMPQGVDFVEIYNRSHKAIDLKGWTLGSAEREQAKVVSRSHSIIYPGEYRVFTQDANTLKGEYLAGHEDTFRETELPILNDDAGSVILYDGTGRIIDSVYYSDDYHSAFVRDGEGVSLERIFADAEEGTENANWRSASGQAGFATPGYVNSNARSEFPSEESVIIDPEVIQPALNAAPFALVRYQFDRGGLMANVTVFDQQGRTVRLIAVNELLGTKGFFRWDGDLDNGSAAAIGYYLIRFELFDAGGRVAVFRKRLAIF